jgi:hypothetical protein
MSKCASCQKEASKEELVADHIMPLSRGGKAHDPDNIQWVHRRCHYKKAVWYKRIWFAIREWYYPHYAALVHELRCAECRVSWKSWFRRLIKDPRGMNPKRYG